MNAASYERLFLLNRCLEQVGEIIEQFRAEGVVHEAYAGDRQRSVEELRADLAMSLRECCTRESWRRA